ncbi:MAG: hypothetical protein U5K54_18995 [Cytophagales bacterium]|nr:hypothetical protein [Cytophagales bacterium]
MERHLRRTDAGSWSLIPGKVSSEEITINTYHDHRMAMGLAPLERLPILKLKVLKW